MAKKKSNIDTETKVTEPKVKKTTKKKAEKQQNLEDILFECRNKLRGNANMTTKRDMLLTLVFLRFISSRFNEQKEKIKEDVLSQIGKTWEELSAEEEDFIGVMQNNKSSYEQDGVFFLQNDYNWEYLIGLPASERAIQLDNGITKLMAEEKNLKNALPSNLFVNARLEPSTLKGVMDDINKIDPRNFKDIDLIGRVYEYFLQQFAVNATKEDGEFYTPQSIVELIATLIEPYDGTIYDPCCGSGGMFVQSVRLIEAHGGNKRNVSVYGQESDPDTYRLAKMNLAARGISYHLGDTNASSFTNDMHPTLRANYIMANPPFNKKDWRTEEQLLKDKRWQGYGLPPISNANYAWILHMLYHLDQVNGVAGFLLSNGALEDEDTVAIREQLIRNDKVEAIFILPAEMFYQVDLSCTLWIVNQNKKGGIKNSRKLRNRENEILFVDLRKWNNNKNTIKTDKSKKTFVTFSDEQISQIAEIYHSWQMSPTLINNQQTELCGIATKDEIEKQGWSLTPSKYIKFIHQAPSLSENELCKETNEIISHIISIEKENSQKIETAKDISSVIRNCIGCPLVPLSELVEAYTEKCGNNNAIVSGVNISKEFIPSKANLENTDISGYSLVPPMYFATNLMHIGRDERIPIALNRTSKNLVVTSAYSVFRVKENKKAELLEEYLYIFFNSKETDRLAWFNTDGSVRGNLQWKRLLETKIPLPNIEVQRSIVNIYQCAEEAKRIAVEADRLSREICPTIMQHIIHESKNK